MRWAGTQGCTLTTSWITERKKVHDMTGKLLGKARVKE
jgi:hypothetical protein